MEKILKLVISTWLLIFSQLIFAAQEEVLKIPLHASSISLNPTSVQDTSSLWVARQIDCQLTRSSSSNIIMEAAKSIKFINSTQLQITIRDDVRFNDGSPVTASDVIASLNNIKSGRHVLRSVFLWIKDIKELNDKNILIDLTGSYPQFLSVLSSSNYAIFKKDFIAKAAQNSELWNYPVGCGGYKVIQNTANKIILKSLKNGYNIEFFLMKDNQLLANQLGSYDISDLHLVGSAKALNDYRIVNLFDPYQVFLGLNSQHGIWRDRNNRCSFISKLDTKKVLGEYGDIARKADDLLPQGIFGYKSNDTVFQSIKDEYFTNALPQLNSFCLAYLSVSIPQDYLNEYLNMTKNIYPNQKVIKIKDTSHFGERLLNSGCDVFIVGLKSNTFDAYDMLDPFSNIDANFTGFSNQKVIKSIKNSQSIFDPNLRFQEYRSIINEIESECVIYPILTIPYRQVYIKKDLITPNIGKGPINDYYLGQVYRE